MPSVAQAGVTSAAEVQSRCATGRCGAQLQPQTESRSGRPGRSSAHRPCAARQAQSTQNWKDSRPRKRPAFGSASRAVSSSGSQIGRTQNDAGWASSHSARFAKHGSATGMDQW